MPPDLDLAARQSMSIEDRMALLERDVHRLQYTEELALNYMQGLAEGLGLRDKMSKLDAEIDELRSGNGGWQRDPELPTSPKASDPP